MFHSTLYYNKKFCRHLDVEGSTGPDISSEHVSEQSMSASEGLSNSNHVHATCDASQACEEDNSSTPFTIECDIGKLMESHTYFHKLDRDAQYQILTTEPNIDPLSYSHKCTSEPGAHCHFQPTWFNSHHRLHYSNHSDGAFCCACLFFT